METGVILSGICVSQKFFRCVLSVIARTVAQIPAAGHRMIKESTLQNKVLYVVGSHCISRGETVMRSTGAIIMSFFAALWGFLALRLGGQALWMQLMPFALSFALALAALNNGRRAAPVPPQERRRIGRTVMIWSFVEGLAIFAGVNLLRNTGHGEWTVALVAVVVGLHFFPLAIGLRVPLYGLTGLGMIGVAAAGVLLVPFGVTQYAAIGLGCAVVLWLTAFVVTAFAPKAGGERQALVH